MKPFVALFVAPFGTFGNLRLLDKSNLKDNSTTTSRATPTIKIDRRPPIICWRPTSETGRPSEYTDVFHDQLKIFCFNIQRLLMFSFHDVKDAEVICVTLTDDLTSWNVPFILWNTWVRVGWCVVRKYTDAPVHLHHFSTTCSADTYTYWEINAITSTWKVKDRFQRFVAYKTLHYYLQTCYYVRNILDWYEILV